MLLTLHSLKDESVYLVFGYNMQRRGNTNGQDENWKMDGIEYLKDNDIFELLIEIDKNKKANLRVFVNDKDYGYAYKNINTPIIPVIEMYSARQIIQLVQSKQIKD